MTGILNIWYPGPLQICTLTSCRAQSCKSPCFSLRLSPTLLTLPLSLRVLFCCVFLYPQSHSQRVEAVCVPVVLEAAGVCVGTTKGKSAQRHLLGDAGRVPCVSSESGACCSVLCHPQRSIMSRVSSSNSQVLPCVYSTASSPLRLDTSAWQSSVSPCYPTAGPSRSALCCPLVDPV